MDRADAEPGPAEIQVVCAPGPVRAAHAEDFLAVRSFHVAHRAVAALAGLQAGKIVAALGGLFEYCRRNFEHYLISSPNFFVF